jgi:hypothetical protein
MLARVRAWIPPTSGHNDLKSFMIKQLKESIGSDCTEPEKPERLCGDDYREGELANARWHVDYHAEQLAKDIQRANERTQWVQALRESLKQEDA